MLAKAYLYRKNYARAGTQLKKFVNGSLKGVYALQPDYRNNFKDINENNGGSLFELQFQEGTGTDLSWTGEPSTAWKQVKGIFE